MSAPTAAYAAQHLRASPRAMGDGATLQAMSMLSAKAKSVESQPIPPPVGTEKQSLSLSMMLMGPPVPLPQSTKGEALRHYIENEPEQDNPQDEGAPEDEASDDSAPEEPEAAGSAGDAEDDQLAAIFGD